MTTQITEPRHTRLQNKQLNQLMDLIDIDRTRRRDGRAPGENSLREMNWLAVACASFAAVILGLAPCTSRADDWLGWRGVSHEGRVAGPPCPVEWSPTNNVGWVAEIPGRGHSSPIVAGDRVFVTTTYVGVQQIKHWIDFGVVGLAALAALLGARLGVSVLTTQTNDNRGLRLNLSAILFWTLLLAFLGLVLFGEAALDYQRVAVRGWLASGLALALACTLCGFFTVGSLLKHLPLWIFSLAAFAGIWWEGQSRIASEGPFSVKACILYLVAGSVLVGTGLSLLLTRVSIRSTDESDNAPQQRSVAHTVGPMLIGTVVGLGGAALAVAILLNTSDYLAYQLRQPRWQPLLGWNSLLAVGVATLVGFGLGVRDVQNSQFVGTVWRGLYRVGILTLGIAVFAKTNFVSPKYLPTHSTQSLVCLDRATGEVRWTCEGLSEPLEDLHTFNSPATPTPAIADGRVVAYFGTAGMFCCNLDGKLLWINKDLPFSTVNGVGSSPTICDGAIVVVSDQPTEAYVAAVNLNDGTEIWRRPRAGNADFGCGVSRTPLVKDIEGIKTVFVWGFDDVTAYELQTGRELWSFRDPALAQHCMVSTLVSDDRALYLGTPTRALAISLAPGLSAANRQLWSTTLSGSNCTSPLLVNGLLFLVSDTGVVTCVDAETGRRVGRQRLKGRYFASPIAVGNKVYFCNDSGLTTIVAADRKIGIEAENDLTERTQASLAPVDGQLFIRTENHLYCIEAQQLADATSP